MLQNACQVHSYFLVQGADLQVDASSGRSDAGRRLLRRSSSKNASSVAEVSSQQVWQRPCAYYGVLR
jgi:hypothetical protein